MQCNSQTVGKRAAGTRTVFLILTVQACAWLNAGLLAQTLSWTVNLGSPQCTVGDGLQIDGKSNLVITKGGCGLVVERYNSAGLRVFQKTLVISNNGFDPYITGTRAATDDKGNTIIAGMFRGTLQVGSYLFNSQGQHKLKSDKKGIEQINKKELDIFVLKLDANGSVLWAKHIYSAKGSDVVTEVATDNEGNVLVAGFMGGPMELYKTSVDVEGRRGQFFVMRFNIRGDYLSAVQPEGIRKKLRDLHFALYNRNLYFCYRKRNGLPVVTKHETFGRMLWKTDPLAKDQEYLRATRGTISLGMNVADEEVRLIGVANKRFRLADGTYRNVPAPWMERLGVADGEPFFKKFIRDTTFVKGPFTKCQTYVLSDGSGYLLGTTTVSEVLLVDVRPNSNSLKDHVTLTGAAPAGQTNFAVNNNYELFLVLTGLGGATYGGRLLNNPNPGEAILMKLQD